MNHKNEGKVKNRQGQILSFLLGVEEQSELKDFRFALSHVTAPSSVYCAQMPWIQMSSMSSTHVPEDKCYMHITETIKLDPMSNSKIWKLRVRN